MNLVALILTLVLNLQTAHAIEYRKSVEVGEDQILYHLVGEGDRFHVTATLNQKNKLPEILWRRIYTSLATAEVDFKSLPGSSEKALAELGEPAEAIEVLNTSLWTVTESWSLEWELAYQRWIESAVDRNFMITNQIETDCADVAYALRWIFSRMNGLPAANRLASGPYFTHRSVRRAWADLPTHQDWRQDQRFLAALNYLLEMTYTHSLEKDSYPLAISSDTLIPGAHFLYIFGDSGHTLVAHRRSSGVNGEAPLRTISSTVPRQVRRLNDSPFYEQQRPQRAGFLKMRWPVLADNGSWTLVAAEQMPGYSIEQYDAQIVGERTFDEFVFDRIAPDRRADPSSRLANLVHQMMDMFRDRITIVKDGYTACFPDRCAEGSADYDNWSTPTRDGRILERIQKAIELVSANRYLRNDWDNFKHFETVNLGDENSDFTRLETLVQIWLRSGFSSNPNDSIEKRWGLE